MGRVGLSLSSKQKRKMSAMEEFLVKNSGLLSELLLSSDYRTSVDFEGTPGALKRHFMPFLQ